MGRISEPAKVLKAHRARQLKRQVERKAKDVRAETIRATRIKNIKSKYEDKIKKLRAQEDQEIASLTERWDLGEKEILLKRDAEDEEDMQIYLAALEHLAETSSRALPLRVRDPQTPDTESQGDGNDELQTPKSDMSNGGTTETQDSSPAETTPARSIFELRREANMAANQALLGEISPLVPGRKRTRLTRSSGASVPTTTTRRNASRAAKDAAIKSIHGYKNVKSEEDSDEEVTLTLRKTLKSEEDGNEEPMLLPSKTLKSEEDSDEEVMLTPSKRLKTTL
ncbi:hypothetical protein PVAG01_05143 [Phlyctema vagabunda]|uniref:Uncharacterized protein n=1 Tax=Phlyctema vagabunda TaxID=108571 RepID=A0ABR4PKD5_9HELO